MTMKVRVDETLEAVALVLRDLKADFEEKLLQIAADGDTRQEGFLSQLAQITHDIDALAERAVCDRRKADAQMEELRQQAAASAAGQREEDVARIQELRTFIENLQGRATDVEATGHTAMKIARATQESMLRLFEDTKQALEPLAEGVDDARAQHQTVTAELAELDAKAVLRPELEELLRTCVFGDLPEGFRAPTLAELHEKTSTLVERFEEFEKLDQETQGLFQRIGVECKSLAAKDEEYREKFTQALEGLAAKKDVEALQELLEETAAHNADVLEFAQKVGEQTDQALEKHRKRVETALEALRDTFSDRQEQLRAQMTGMRVEIFEGLAAEVQASIDARSKDSDRMLVQQAERFVTKLSENIKGERGPAGQVSRVQQWVADYQFPELALVRHRAGLWQALCDTMTEPGTSGSDWQLVAAGIFEMEVAPDEACPGRYRLIIRDSDNRRHELGFHVPLPTFHKTWVADHEYRHYDSVMEDGHRWLATKDAPTGPPSRSEDWILLGMRGGRGARGAKGDPGAAGPAPDMEEILDAYDQRRLDANGTPISSFRGTWRFGADYVVGDFVRGPGVVALCREAHRAESPPTSMNGRWEILFDLPDPGAEGGPRPQDLQAQITALTTQVQALAGAE